MQYLGDLGCEHIVLKNDEKTVEEIADMAPRGHPGITRPRCGSIYCGRAMHIFMQTCLPSALFQPKAQKADA